MLLKCIYQIGFIPFRAHSISGPSHLLPFSCSTSVQCALIFSIYSLQRLQGLWEVRPSDIVHFYTLALQKLDSCLWQ